MICPYRKKITREEERHAVKDYIIINQTFPDCLKNECPFYFKIKKEKCLRAEREYIKEITINE